MAGSIYQTVFGGNVVAPAIPTYLALNISANVILGWPLESNITAPSVAEIIDVTATVGALTIQLSDARQVGVGYCALFNNVGANTFSVLDASGATIAAIASGQVWQIYISDNSTLAGTWRVFQYGAGASSANAAALAGNGLKAITTTLNERIFINAQGSNYAIQNSDRAACVEWTGGSGGTFTAPAPATVGSDWFCYIKNAGTGVLTLAPAAGNIDGTSSKSFNPNDSCVLISDGTNLITLGFGQSVASSFNFVTISLAGASGNVILAGAQLNRISYKFTGALAGNTVIVVPASIQQYWIDNETTGAFTLTISAGGAGTTFVVPQANRTILYCDGLNIVNAITGGGVTFGDGTAAAPSITFASDTTMGFYKAGTDVLGISTAGVQRGVISSAGQWVINASASGTTLSVTGVAGAYAISVTSSSTASQGFGQVINAGTNGSDISFLVRNQAASTNYLQVRGDGQLVVNPGGSGGFTAGTTGMTINTPSSGTALAVTGGGAGATTILASSGQGATGNAADIQISRAGSTVNIVANGPNIELFDTTNTTASTLQNSGGQTELWQYNAGWNQILKVLSTRGVAINAPASGATLSVNGAANIQAVQITGSATTGQSYGLVIDAGTNSADFPLQVQNKAVTLNYLLVRGDGAFFAGPSANSLLIGTAGNVTINAPSSGVPLTVTGPVAGVATGLFTGGSGVSGRVDIQDGQTGTRIWSILSGGSATGVFNLFDRTAAANRLTIDTNGAWTIPAPGGGTTLSLVGVAGQLGLLATGSSTSGVSFGIAANAGTTSADYGLLVQNQAGSVAYFKVRGDGVVFGNDGTSLFELGYKDTPLNVQGSNYTLVAADRGKSVQASANGLTFTVNNAVFSAGAVVSIFIGNGASLTIAQGAGMTLQWAGNGASTGSRTLTGAGIATLLFASASVALISGAGLS